MTVFWGSETLFFNILKTNMATYSAHTNAIKHINIHIDNATQTQKISASMT